MSDEHFAELLRKYIPDASDQTCEILAGHYRLLLKWNTRINLTKLVPGEEMVRRHYAESLFLAQFIPTDTKSVVDLGSGAGFPGCPVAIARPECQVTLIDADQRKSIFLRESTVEMSNISVISLRAEQVSGDWNAVISRAVDVSGVRKFAIAHSGWLGLLTSDEIAANFDWDEITQLPWEPRHVVAKLKVSRGTD